MQNQLIFPQESIVAIRERFNRPEGDKLYLQDRPFATDLKTLESPTIAAVENLNDSLTPDNHFQTAVKIYEAFPNLNALEASSIGFWTYLTHVDLWKYMQKRFKLDTINDEKTRRNKIIEQWFLREVSQSSLMRHPIAGFWWGVKISISPERGDGKYDFTKVLFRDLDVLTRTLGTYNLGRLPNAIRGICGFVHEHKDLFKQTYEKKMRLIMRHFSSIGGVIQLGCMPEEFFKEELLQYQDTIANTKQE